MFNIDAGRIVQPEPALLNSLVARGSVARQPSEQLDDAEYARRLQEQQDEEFARRLQVMLTYLVTLLGYQGDLERFTFGPGILSENITSNAGIFSDITLMSGTFLLVQACLVKILNVMLSYLVTFECQGHLEKRLLLVPAYLLVMKILRVMLA
jgi:hypothetical protein